MSESNKSYRQVRMAWFLREIGRAVIDNNEVRKAKLMKVWSVWAMKTVQNCCGQRVEGEKE